MKKIKKFIKNNKNSFFGLVLALILTFSFNYTPISLVSKRLAGLSSNAYSSSTSQTYYKKDSVTKENGISTGNYANGTSVYFKDSTNNYHILTKYTEVFNKLFKGYVEKFLVAQDKLSSGYDGIYAKYLEYLGYETLSAYYEDKSSSTLSSYSSFRAFFEYFVTTDITWRDSDGNEYTLPSLFDQTQLIFNYYQSFIYNSLANFIEDKIIEINTDSLGRRDGLYEGCEFYSCSTSYLRIVSFFNEIIAKTGVTSAYDGKTQDTYIAAIIASNAPVSQDFYYETDVYDTVKKTSFSYVQQSYSVESGSNFYKPTVYYFGSEADLYNIDNYITFKNNGYLVNTNYNISELETSTLYYRPIQVGEYGYMDDDHTTYYKYASIPYDTTNSNYEIYVVDDDVTESEQTSYDSLYYVHVISSDELNTDRENITSSDGVRDTKNCFYVQVPYLKNSTNNADIFFSKIFSSISQSDYQRIINLFIDENKNSKIYFKISSSTYTSTTNIVYVDPNETTISEFYVNNSNYSYVLEYLSLEDGLTMSDYSSVEAGTAYYVKDTNLYFKKVRSYFEKTTYNYDGYITSNKPNVTFEQTTVSSGKLENKDVFALVNEIDVDGTTYKTITANQISLSTSNLYEQITDSSLNSNYKFYYKHTLTSDGDADMSSYETLNDQKVIYVLIENVQIGENSYSPVTSSEMEIIRNLYTKVSSAVSKEINGENNSYELFYKYATQSVNQIYIIDDSKDANTNEVYKNLNYKVLTENDYKNTFFNYVAIDSTDANYNENFKLYYKINLNLDESDDYSKNDKLFVQNAVTGRNAVYIIDDSLTSNDKASYRSLRYTTITTDEFNKNSDFYVLIDSNDSNYNSTYTKLYYKYKSSNETERDIYIYSSKSSTIYNSFYNTDSDYVASDYELIEQGDPNYVTGLELYYKKNRTNSTTTTHSENSFFYYSTSSTVELSANSFYNISFYAYTNGNYYDENDELQYNDIEASFYITDTSSVISDISIEHISTDGKWVQYNAFIATDAISSSKINLSMYLGTKDSIAGKYDASTISGTVLFDNITVTLIGETDYNNHTIDASPVQKEIEETETESEDFTIVTKEDINEIESRYVLVEDLTLPDGRKLPSNNTFYYKHNVDNDDVVLDSFEEDSNGNKKIYVYFEYNNSESDTFAVNVIVKTTTYTDVDEYKNTVFVVSNDDIGENETLDNRTRNNSIINNWNSNFNFDENDNLSNRIDNIKDNFNGDEDGFTDHEDWHFYISRDDSGQGNNELLKALNKAYLDGKASISVIEESTIDKTEIVEDDEDDEDEDEKDDEDEDDEDDDEEEDKDVATIGSTFNSNNKVLKISNKDRLRSLGIASSTFTIKQHEYYKITVWIYSPDKDATATIKVESVLKTSSTQTNGSLVSVTADSISAHLSDYDKAPTNEYSFIPVSFYIEGNAYHNQDVSLVLLADSNSTIYFDNISIEKVTSTKFDTINSDSDDLTYCLSLSPTSSLISSGITNGYFNNMTLTEDYITRDYTKPNKAENWTTTDSSSANVIAGVVPTSNDYMTDSTIFGTQNNFFTKYNNDEVVPTNGFNNNIYGIYAPTSAKASIEGADETTYKILNNYSIYSSSISLSAKSMYEISFEFFAGYNFKGNLVASLYSSSVSSSNIVSNMTISSDDIAEGWNKYTFYVQTGTASATIYLEIGVSEATGTAFFQKASNVTSSYKSIEEARDSIINESENTENSSITIDEYASLSTVRFVNASDMDFSVHSAEKNENGLYNSTNYLDSNTNSSSYTVGKSGTAVASFYTSKTTTTYTVQIKDVKYIKDTKTEDSSESNYISETKADNNFYIKLVSETVEGQTTSSYKLYADSMFTIEVVGFDINMDGKISNSEIGNFEITKTGDSIKVTVNETENEATEVKKTEYSYKFNEDINLNGNIIAKEELNNNYSQNVLILSNGRSTDLTTLTPTLKGSLASSSYYVIRIYAKTKDIVALNSTSKSGLNISIDTLSVNWKNINTENSKNADENGFVCYELWVKTNTSSFSDLKVKLSLGDKDSTCSGYAIIAKVDIEQYSSETLFNEYCDSKAEFYDSDDENSIVKRYFGKASTSSDDDDDDDDDSSLWATFFYIFSSLLLGIVLIMALVAVIIKKHPIKSKKRVSAENDIIVINSKETKKDSKENKKKETSSIETTNSNEEKVDKKKPDESTNKDDEGFV